MKRYFGFYGFIYYPSGGMEDFVCDCDTIEECVELINKKHNEDRNQWDYQWYQVYDTVDREFVIEVRG